MNIGPMEIAIVLILALLVFGPKRLPQAGRSLGQAVRELRKATAAARSDLGLDEVAADVKDLKSSLGVDEVAAGVRDLTSSMTIDLRNSDKPAAATPAPSAVAPAVAGVTPTTDLAVPPSPPPRSPETPADEPPRRRFHRTVAGEPVEGGPVDALGPDVVPDGPPRRRFGKTTAAAAFENDD